MAFVRSPHAHARVIAVGGRALDGRGDRGPRRARPRRRAARAHRRARAAPAARGRRGALRRSAGRGGRGRVARAGRGRRRRAWRSRTSRSSRWSTRAPGEPLVRWEKHEGDVAGAFAAAAHVVRTEHVIPRLAAVPMEPRGALAAPDGDRLTVWSSSQSAHRPRAQLAQILGRDRGVDPGRRPGRRRRVRIQGHARRWRRRWSRSRRSSSAGRSSGPRIGARTSCRRRRAAGCARRSSWRSTPTAGSWRCAAGCSPTSAPTCCRARRSRRTRPRCCSPGCYDIQAVEVFVTGARTNKVPTGPYRGAGRPEASYLIETTLDAAARELGIDPVELRRRNLVRSFPYRTALGWTYDSGDFERCLDRAVELIAEEPRHRRPRAATGRRRPRTSRRARRPPDVLVGTGVALSVERSGGLFECAEIHVDEDGDVLVVVGSTPTGQGHETLFAQIAAEQARRRSGAGDRAHRRHRRARATASARSRAARRRWAARPSRRPPTTCWRTAGRVGPRALRVRPGLRQRRVRGGRRGRPRDRRGARPAARRRRRRRADHEPAAGRGAGRRRLRAGARRVPDRGGRRAVAARLRRC